MVVHGVDAFPGLLSNTTVLYSSFPRIPNRCHVSDSHLVHHAQKNNKTVSPGLHAIMNVGTVSSTENPFRVPWSGGSLLEPPLL